MYNIGSDNGLSPGRRQAIIWTSAGYALLLLLLIWMDVKRPWTDGRYSLYLQRLLNRQNNVFIKLLLVSRPDIHPPTGPFSIYGSGRY